MTIRRFAYLSALTLMTLGACSDVAGTGGAGSGGAGTSDAGELTVFAAASLNAAFPEIAEDVFAQDYPDVEVNFAFEGSSSLVEKMRSGAAADVFASANVANMDKAVAADLVNEPAELTKNTLRLIVPAGNPAGVSGLESANAANFVICAPQVPCGGVSAELAESAGIDFTPVSEEQSVTDVRTKVETGEADAGLVYLTDALLAGNAVEIVEVEGITAVGTVYMIATLADAPNPELAAAFMDAVMSDAGRDILATYGFGDD